MTPRPNRRSGRFRSARLLPLLAVPVLAVPLIAVAAPGSAAETEGTDGTGPSVTVLSGSDEAPSSEPITLVTGDQVFLEPADDGRQVAVVEAAPRSSGQEPAFEVLEDGDAVYVFPSDATEHIPDQLDPELFNITKLTEYGYDDGVSVIVTEVPQRGVAAAPEGLTDALQLSSVDGYAATVEPDGDWWSSIEPETGGGFGTAAMADTSKVWLDEVAKVSLAESVPMIGAPQAWDAGFDGTGSTVAVLDTGVDPDHPDLVGRIVGAENFTTEPDTSDGHGHGTHVAGTVAGTGAGSDGLYTGVAPGADLLIGKICNSAGNCPNSGSIAAMEWAAPQADVISMSIGTNTGNDGTAPTAMAVNELSEQYDALFVIAAGNNGTQGAGSIGAPGAADAALTVGAVDKNGDLASFSSRGPRLGDSAIKPDITAPGVGIVAARAAGTSMGTPVNDLYTGANGTSMATPHISGAVAIVKQKYPDLVGEELKTLMATTATSNPDLSVYEQGGGLATIPAALDAPIVPDATPLNLGFFPFGAEREPVERAVTYTNRTDAEVTLDLTVDVAHEDGAAVPAAALSVSPAALTVPAGGTATATVMLDVTTLPTGIFGGYLVADDGTSPVHVPVGFTAEGEMYDVVIKGIARDGRPARGASQLHVRHAVDWDIFAQNTIRFVDGEAHLRVPPGPYHVAGAIRTYDGSDRTALDKTMVTIPTLDVTEDTTVTLDAREANEITFETPEHPEARPHDRSRVYMHFESEEDGHLTATWLSDWEPTFALESETPTVGGNVELVVNARVGEAPLILQMAGPESRDLHPRSIYPSPYPDDDRELPVVYAGDGAESDYADLDVDGKVALIERAEEDHSTQAAAAYAQGAEALLVRNFTTGVFYGRADGAQIPVLALSDVEGTLLKEHLADGDVTVRLAGTPHSSYLYDLFMVEKDRIPADLNYEIDQDELMTRENAFYGPSGHETGEYRAAWRPYMDIGMVQRSTVPAGTTRTDYVTADDTKFRQDVSAAYPSIGSIKERDAYHDPGDHQERDWFKGPMKPSILEAAPPLNPGYPVTRTGSTIRMTLMEWFDNADHYGARHDTYDTGAFRVYKDGVQFGETPWPRVSINNLDPEQHTYRFEVDMAREQAWWPTSTNSRTAWTVPSAQPTSGTEVLPFLLVDYDTDVDLTNTLPHPRDHKGPITVDLNVRHQKDSVAADIAVVKFWVSYDDGETWAERRVRSRGDGRYEAVLSARDAEGSTGFVSTRTEIWDVDGNGFEQDVIRAWRLGTR